MTQRCLQLTNVTISSEMPRQHLKLILSSHWFDVFHTGSPTPFDRPCNRHLPCLRMTYLLSLSQCILRLPLWRLQCCMAFSQNKTFCTATQICCMDFVEPSSLECTYECSVFVGSSLGFVTSRPVFPDTSCINLATMFKTVSKDLVWPTSSCQGVISLTFPIQ